MNWLLIVVGVIFLVGVIMGVVRGGLRIAVSLGTTIATLLLVFILTPYVSKAIYSLTPADDLIESTITRKMANIVTTSGLKDMGLTEESLLELLKERGISEKALESAGISLQDILDGNVSSSVLKANGLPENLIDSLANGEAEEVEAVEGEEVSEDADIPRDVQMSAIQNADLPNIFKSLLRDNNNSEVYSALGATNFLEYISTYLTKIIIGILAFLITFIVLTIVFRSIIFALDIFTKIPGIGALNRLAGAVAGFLIALIVVDLIFVVITLCYTTGFGQQLFAMIDSEPILGFLCDHNLVMRMATSFR